MQKGQLCSRGGRRRRLCQVRIRKRSTAAAVPALTGVALTLPKISGSVPITRYSSSSVSPLWARGFITLLDQVKPITGDNPLNAMDDALREWVESQVPTLGDGIDIEPYLAMLNGEFCKGNDEMGDFDDMNNDDGGIAIGLNSPAFFYIGPALTQIEQAYTGIGARAINAIDNCPINIFTPRSVEGSMEARWEDWDDDDPDLDDGFSRKEFEKIIPVWARHNHQKHGKDNDVWDAPWKALLYELEQKNKIWWDNREKRGIQYNTHRNFSAPGICTSWLSGNDDDPIKRVWDDDIEYAQQMSCELFLDIVFSIDFKKEEDPKILEYVGEYLQIFDTVTKLLAALDKQSHELEDRIQISVR